MKKIIKKPHLFFFGLVPVFIFVSFFFKGKIIDINFYSNYFVISYFHFYLLSATFFAMIGINYFSLIWADKPPKKWLTILHLFFQLVALLLFITQNNWNWIGHDSSLNNPLLNDNSNIIIVISFLIFLLSAFIHVINFFVSLFLKRE